MCKWDPSGGRKLGFKGGGPYELVRVDRVTVCVWGRSETPLLGFTGTFPKPNRDRRRPGVRGMDTTFPRTSVGGGKEGWGSVNSSREIHFPPWETWGTWTTPLSEGRNQVREDCSDWSGARLFLVHWSGPVSIVEEGDRSLTDSRVVHWVRPGYPHSAP